MFTDFFYTLRKRKVPVSITEWVTLMEALDRGCIKSLDDFYFLARAILVKSEAHFDSYDVAFQEYFGQLDLPAEISDRVFEWTRGALEKLPDGSLDLDSIERLNFEDLLKEFARRLKEQTEQHDGGNKWIGRGGTSPFGHSGHHPAGIRVGGESSGNHAVKIAAERRFRNYRSDVVLDTRQIKLALKNLRRLSRIGPEEELDLTNTIKATARNAGEIDLIWQASRKNAARVLLLMDVGGTMLPYVQLCNQLFSAANSSSHFREFRYYYFHNCIYDKVYRDVERGDSVSTHYLLRTLEPDFKVILVGDATMGPWELTDKNGAIDYYEHNDTPGIVWLNRIADHFTHCVWLNPEDERAWVGQSTQLIRKVFPMYPLTLDGLQQAVKKLVVKK